MTAENNKPGSIPADELKEGELLMQPPDSPTLAREIGELLGRSERARRAFGQHSRIDTLLRIESGELRPPAPGDLARRVRNTLWQRKAKGVMAVAAAVAVAVVCVALVLARHGNTSPLQPPTFVQKQPVVQPQPAPQAPARPPIVLVMEIPMCMMDATPEELMMLLDPPGLNSPIQVASPTSSSRSLDKP